MADVAISAYTGAGGKIITVGEREALMTGAIIGSRRINGTDGKPGFVVTETGVVVDPNRNYKFFRTDPSLTSGEVRRIDVDNFEQAKRQYHSRDDYPHAHEARYHYDTTTGQSSLNRNRVEVGGAQVYDYADATIKNWDEYYWRTITRTK